MVLRTFNFWRFVGQYRKTIVFNDMFSKKSLKSMVLSTFNFWSFCGQYRDFHYYCAKSEIKYEFLAAVAKSHTVLQNFK